MDALTSATLKHLRERWWNDEFTEFLAETLRPRAGNRILDVGCGEGTGEISIGRLHVSQLRLVGIDLVVDKAIAARTGDGRPQHARAVRGRRRVPAAVQGRGLRLDVLRGGAAAHPRRGNGHQRVRARDGVRRTCRGRRTGQRRPLLLQLDALGPPGFAGRGAVFRRAVRRARRHDRSVHRPEAAGDLRQHGIEPIDVRLFPVPQIQLGAPAGRNLGRSAGARGEAIAQAQDCRRAEPSGREYLVVLDAYRSEAEQAGASFVEIQNTMLFATVGQRSE